MDACDLMNAMDEAQAVVAAAELFKALSSPSRLALLRQLATGPLHVS